ncbi:Uncharacterized protein FWK35_00011597 [Aphis craccivora]|uniref:Uncharacterized protein n=1 Tax=Aphis craccivora TaxID=307492 RepID=A0A6G0YRG0_APHCR|nr:Uncharacterized protein FWK35_00011597 [Aphis craccivora]
MTFDLHWPLLLKKVCDITIIHNEYLNILFGYKKFCFQTPQGGLDDPIFDVPLDCGTLIAFKCDYRANKKSLSLNVGYRYAGLTLGATYIIIIVNRENSSRRALGTDSCWVILDSERSDECIDFTILTCLNKASISNNGGGVSDGKLNLVGALGRSFFEIPNSFQKHREKPKIN